MREKRSVFKSNILFTFSVIFVVCCFMATASWAARKVEFCQANADGYIRQLNETKSLEGVSMGKTPGLARGEEFTLLRQETDFNGVAHYRYQQAYQGIPVWGMQVIVSAGPDNRVVRLNGTMVLDIANDIKNIPPVSSLNPAAALKQMQENHKAKNKGAAWHFRNEQYGTYIYIDKKQKAHACYVVSFFADSESGDPSRFIYFIDIKTGGVLHSFDRLTYAEGTGPGGNLKIGYYEYGIDYPGFGVTEDNGVCTMITADVITIDLEHKAQGTTPYSYTCYRNTHEAINGGYCPLNDAQYYGQAAFDMYKNWYGIILGFSPLRLRCHYKKDYDGAFWDGSYLNIGDGYVIYYPLVTVDIIVHELSHGFTEFNSDLIYSSQSGGINESFSDMSGEAAIYYMRGANHFMVQYEIYKDPDGALRYMYDPPLDGYSIGHVDDYYEGMDVHYSSGIFNKAFYLIATSPGWTTRMAFDIFIRANQVYWVPSTTFQQGAEGALWAALDLGYNCQDVVDAFAQVGIPLNCPGPPAADFVGSPTSGGVPLTVNFTDLSATATSWSWNFGDGGVSTEKNPVHTYTSIGVYTVTLTASNPYGADTEVKTDYITVTSDPGGEMYVYDITQTIAVQGQNYKSTAVVTIRDTGNTPVANAAVFITWSGVVSGSDSGITGSDGTVTFESTPAKSTGPFTITVDNVTHATLTYNPALNNETSDSASY